MSAELKIIAPHSENDVHPLKHTMLPNPRKCARMLCRAPSASGKSVMVKNLITNPNFGFDRYYGDNIIIGTKDGLHIYEVER